MSLIFCSGYKKRSRGHKYFCVPDCVFVIKNCKVCPRKRSCADRLYRGSGFAAVRKIVCGQLHDRHANRKSSKNFFR